MTKVHCYAVFFFFFCFLFFFFFFPSVQTPPSPFSKVGEEKTDWGYDHLKLVLQWQPTYCYPKVCEDRVVENKFSIHGLWSDGKAHQHLCRTDGLKKEMISSIREELEEKWPSLKEGVTDLSFWQHEWNAHGKCSAFSQLDYFKTALKLFDDVSLLKLLENNQYVPTLPSLKIWIKLQPFVDTIMRNRKRPVIRCIGWNQKHLHEVEFCVDPDSLKLINCQTLLPPLTYCFNSKNGAFEFRWVLWTPPKPQSNPHDDEM